MVKTRRGEEIEIDYEVRENTLSISHLYVRQSERRQGMASERIEELVEEYDVDFVRVSISSNESSRSFLEEEGFIIEHDNSGGLIEAFRRV
jgi:GNAT superfamily N-acetyltransferase